jgi:hypothetical protein
VTVVGEASDPAASFLNVMPFSSGLMRGEQLFFTPAEVCCGARGLFDEVHMTASAIVQTLRAKFMSLDNSRSARPLTDFVQKDEISKWKVHMPQRNCCATSL